MIKNQTIPIERLAMEVGMARITILRLQNENEQLENENKQLKESVSKREEK